jgi:hypothetical protein
MQVEVVRRGGLIGVPMRGSIDTGQLPEPAASRATGALRELPFGKPPAAPTHPDSFQYEITVVEAGDRRQAVIDESQLPSDLRSLVDGALRR